MDKQDFLNRAKDIASLCIEREEEVNIMVSDENTSIWCRKYGAIHVKSETAEEQLNEFKRRLKTLPKRRMTSNESITEVLEKVLEELPDQKSQAGWAIGIARAGIKRGVTPALVLKTLLLSLCKSYD